MIRTGTSLCATVILIFSIKFGFPCFLHCSSLDLGFSVPQSANAPTPIPGSHSFFTNPPRPSRPGEQNSNSAAGQSTSNDVNTDFENYIAELFRQEASASLLNLHYTLENPQAYQITEYQTSLGNYSAASPALAAASAENVLSALHQFDAQKI